MNDTIRTILDRRSIRAYRSGQIESEELDLILEAGRYAPSAMNQQSWHFTVVRDRELLDRLESSLRTVFLESGIEALRKVAERDDFRVFYNAPMLIIVTGDSTALAPSYDCTLAMENMMLAAASLGIGSCWMHAVMMCCATQKGRKLFNELGLVFPENHEPYAAAVFGYRAAPLPPPEPRKPDAVTIIG